MKTLAAALVLATATARIAFAQPGNVEPIDPDEPPPPPPGYTATPQTPQLLPPDRSESTALWLSLGGTLASYALVFGGASMAAGSNDSTSRLASSAASVGLVGTLVAPTFGHWYGGKGFTRGFGLRLGAMAVGVTALVVAFSGCSFSFGHDSQDDDSECGRGETGGALLGLLAVSMWIGGTVDDIVQAPRRVRRRNSARFALTPLVQGDRAGLALVGAF
ncbi:MAG: hypothetical protein H0T42_08695 [Deltaproteobacteria bacterium]|nr:hypothetical protein [Deltaproteobacteria bacterium]